MTSLRVRLARLAVCLPLILLAVSVRAQDTDGDGVADAIDVCPPDLLEYLEPF